MMAVRVSALACRYGMMAPGMTDCGSVSHALSLSSVQVKSAFAKPAEYLNPATLPTLRPTMPASSGPCRGGSEAFVAWHVAHCRLNSVAPSAALACGNAICALAPAISNIMLTATDPMEAIGRDRVMGVTVELP